MKKVPILVMAFNRPEMVRKAMAPIQIYQPDRLYLACDGPRADIEGEQEIVESTRKVMLDTVDWPCEVKTLFREKNLGCAKAVYEAISWFFEHEKYGIIIEDDVIVGRDFYNFCEELLPLYQDNPIIQQIAAFNPAAEETSSNGYTFTKRPMIWGWATWKSKWEDYMDMNMTKWPSFSKLKLIQIYGFRQGLYMWRAWSKAFERLRNGVSWDTRWHFAAVANDLISICPKVNLSINIGCSTEGAHYHEGDINPYLNLKIGSFSLPVDHPQIVGLDSHQVRIDKAEFIRVRFLGLKNKVLKFFHI